MKILKRTKKGFTLVELIVVIAIVAILAAVSVVSYLAFINQANESADIQLVKQLNVALQADEVLNGPRDTMHEMLGAMEDNGFVVENLTKTKSGYDIVWDETNNRFGLTKADNTLVYGESTYDSSVTHTKWKFADTLADLPGKEDQKYSIYLTEEFAKTNATELTVYAGLDVGSYNKLTSISYKNTSDNDRKVTIRTNSATAALTIDDASTGSIYHYGSAGALNIIQCHTASYHENGNVAYVEIAKGRIVLEKGADVEEIHINKKTNSSFDTVIIANNGGTEELPERITRDAVTVTEETLVVKVESNGSSENVYVYADGTTGKTNKVTEGENLQNENVNSALGQLVLDNGSNPGEKAQTTEQKEAAKTEAVENAQAEEIEGDFWIGVAADSFHGGDGSENNPWIITNAQELALVSKMVNSNNMHGANADNNIYYKNDYYIITNNIYLAAKAWTPIGTKTNMFSGHISADNGVKINGLTNKDHGGADFNLVLYRSTSGTEGYAGYGFIGYADGCTADNLYFESAKIDVTDSNPTKFSMVGILAGEIKGVCEFSNITIDSDSKIISQDKVGGMVGHNSGNLTVSNSTFSGYAEAKNYRCGGFLGQTDTTTLSFNACTFNGVVITPNSKGWAGGFLGQKSAGDNIGKLKNPGIISFIDCNSVFNTETVKGTNGFIGSYVGWSTGVVYNFTGSSLSGESLTTLDGTVGCVNQVLRGILGTNVYQVYPSGDSEEPIDVVYAFAAGKNHSKDSTTWKQINGLAFNNGKFEICGAFEFGRSGSDNGMKITEIDVINNLATGYKVQLCVTLGGYTDNNTVPVWEIARWRVVSNDTASADATVASAPGYWDTHTSNDGKSGQWFDYDAKFIGSGTWNKYYDLTNNVIDSVNVTTSKDYYIVVPQ